VAQRPSTTFRPMTDEQIDMLRRLIQDEIEVAGVDGMEHGVWGFMDSQLDKRWKEFQESFNEEQALKALDKLYQENDNGMKELANESND
jgi:hypothetical protein